MEKQRLAWNEIKERHPDQWVSLADVEKDEHGEIRSGIVVAFGPDLKTVTRTLKAQHLLSDRSEYTGTIKGFLGFSKWTLDVEDAADAKPLA